MRAIQRGVTLRYAMQKRDELLLTDKVDEYRAWCEIVATLCPQHRWIDQTNLDCENCTDGQRCKDYCPGKRPEDCDFDPIHWEHRCAVCGTVMVDFNDPREHQENCESCAFLVIQAGDIHPYGAGTAQEPESWECRAEWPEKEWNQFLGTGECEPTSVFDCKNGCPMWRLKPREGPSCRP